MHTVPTSESACHDGAQVHTDPHMQPRHYTVLAFSGAVVQRQPVPVFPLGQPPSLYALRPSGRSAYRAHTRGLSVLVRRVSMRARGSSTPHGRHRLALPSTALLPSVPADAGGSLIAYFAQYPDCPRMARVRMVATRFLDDSFIHYSTPVLSRRYPAMIGCPSSESNLSPNFCEPR